MLNVILTGATGAVGHELLPRLIQSGYRVFCVVRAKDDAEARERLRKVYDHPHAIAIRGDITHPGCGINLDGLPRIDKFVHSAADVRFDDQFAAEISATNFNGTENALRLASVLRVPEFHFVSTTYLAGDANVLLEESVGEELQLGKPRNAYEASKAKAEGLVRKWDGGRVSIYRLSIVVGRASDGATSTFDGFYGFFKGFHRIAERFRSGRELPEGPISLAKGVLYLPVAIEAVAVTRLNLIQSDWLAETMTKLIALPARGETYNLAHPEPMTVGDVIRCSLDVLGIAGVEVLPRISGAAKDRKVKALQKMVSSGLDRYKPYVFHGQRFVCRNAKRDLGSDFKDPPQMTCAFLGMTLRYAIEVWERESKRSRGPSVVPVVVPLERPRKTAV